MEHSEGGTTDRLSDTVHLARAGDLYLRAHRDQVARKAPALVLPSCLLPPGHVVADRLPSTGAPILVYRNPSDGSIQAYENRCRHRGAALVDPEVSPRPLKGFGLACPYHSWTYDARTGALRRVPGEEDGFPCLDKNSLGLQPVPSREIAGGIWVGGDMDCDSNNGANKAEEAGKGSVTDESWWPKTRIDDELRDLWPSPSSIAAEESTRLVGFHEWQLEANWQLIVETFLESYHVPFLHQDTLGVVTQKKNMVVDQLDARSVRHTLPLTNFGSDGDGEEQDDTFVSPKDPFFSQTTTTYFVFPNVGISLFKRFALFISILPYPGNSSTDASKQSRVRLWGVTQATAEGEDPAVQKRDFDSVIRGIEEDWACVEGIQRGMRHDTVFHHGRFEGINVNFLRDVEDVANHLETRS